MSSVANVQATTLQPANELTPLTVRNAANPYTLEATLSKLRHFLTATKRTDAVELLEKAVKKASADKAYKDKMEDALLRGSTIECRDLFTDFGEYFEKPSTRFPFYPHHDSVNAIDTALFHIKLGYEQQAIDDFNFLHNDNS
ncbi:hypothetical protein [Alcaligenes faecalis]|uniref:Uncharacterized protein n=1 Tax=Alcaligenes faecalis TaxID=511 RepID=A0A1Z3MKW7_ALCFA|nr:hypothetical protein [Alcaligenes faecalis]ASD48454.1 hypothetical protein [Alcaligenes faecalis]OSZ33039.1 hypothetical protein BVZ28_13565 [Alcaligenes faecalis]OSZ41136.1 hypothetical protein BVZ29_13200 [Alcaligenes faecalis]